ncbi:MAG: hypothetical protein ACYCWE_21245 [Eubacteriales bacterium]
MLNRVLAGLLITVIIFTLFTACAAEQETPLAGTETTVAAETTADGKLYDNLPELDYNGAEFVILTALHGAVPTSFFYAEEETGDTMNDALYKRNTAVEERFNITFNEIVLDDIFKTTGQAQNASTAGDASYDLVMVIDREARALAMKGYLTQVSALPNLDLTKEYWNQQMMADISIDGKLFYVVGDDNIMYCNSITNLIFSKKLQLDYNLESPYDLIYSGKWTMDAYAGMCRAVTSDLNGDGKWTDTDQYGILALTNMYFPNFYVVNNELIVKKDSDDIPYFNVPGNDRMFSIIQKIFDISSDESLYNIGVKSTESYKADERGPYYQIIDMFRNSMSLFASAGFYTILATRAIEDDFGIIPYPKFEEVAAGTPYYSRTFGGFPYVVVNAPVDLERASVIMEALACESHNVVIPAMYDILLKTKSARDADSEYMIDMLRKYRYTDLAETYWLSEIGGLYEGLFIKKENTAASVTEKNTAKVESTLQKAFEAIQALK